ncbi:MAG: MarR family transcriptional regulator, partial [Bacillota bacterium]
MGETKKEILGRFMRLQGLLHRYQAQSFMNFGPWGNPQRGQGRVLALLKLKPEISQKELTYLLDMSKQGLAELLNKLEKNEFITRETSEEDRRSVNIKLTEKGAAVAGEMGDMPPELEKLFDVLNDEEL